MAAPPDLASLASDWLVANSSGVKGVPMDCPSISNVMGSVGSCGPTCPSLIGYNSFTSGPFLQGACGATLYLDGVETTTRAHKWEPFEVHRNSQSDGGYTSASLRLLNDGRALLLNVAFTRPV